MSMGALRVIGEGVIRETDQDIRRDQGKLKPTKTSDSRASQPATRHDWWKALGQIASDFQLLIDRRPDSGDRKTALGPRSTSSET